MSNRNWKMFLVAGVLCMALTPIAQAAVVTDHLVSWWKFDETGNTTTAVDSQGSNDGTLNGFPTPPGWTTDTAGSASSGALVFDSTDAADAVNCGHDSSLKITGAITVEAWVKPDGWTNAATFGREQVAGRYDCYSLSYESWGDGSLEFRLGNDTNRVAYGTEFDSDTWYHIAGVYTGTHLLLYMDGTEVASMAYSSGIPASDTIDMTLSLTANPYNGIMDEVRVYNDALSLTEIQQNYAAIPEPATMSLLLLGLPFALRRRR